MKCFPRVSQTTKVGRYCRIVIQHVENRRMDFFFFRDEVLNDLEPVDGVYANANKESVSVVKKAGNESVDDRFG